jgi:hypothetical protein
MGAREREKERAVNKNWAKRGVPGGTLATHR